LNAIETLLVEIDGGGRPVDPDRCFGELVLGHLHHDGAFAEKEHGAIGLAVAAERDRVKAQGGVLVDPDHVPVGKNDLHPGLAGGIDSIARDEWHIDQGFNGVGLGGGLDRGIAFEIGDVTQGGQFVPLRGHCRPRKRDHDCR